ncbi:MAG: hypothetical protein ACT4QC_17130 [Planctomycetaceae bacterium]
MNINGRLLLLLVVAGLFVRVWGANQPRYNRYATYARLQYSLPRHEPRPVAIRRPQIAVDRVALRHIDNGLGAEELWNPSNCPIPLPAGLAGGAYRAASDSGRVARLELPDPSLSAQTLADQPVAGDAAADFVSFNVGNVRWYLIRLNVDSIAAQEPETSPARPNDAAGFTSATSTVAPVIEQAERPDHPALPSPL